MEIALYHPQFGYYATNTTQVGKAGDFFTSVSVGTLFGELLAADLANFWKNQLGSPSRWRLLELGAHTGTLALDILTFLASHHPTAYSSLEYTLCEPQEKLQQTQQQTLSAHSAHTTWCQIQQLSDLTPLPGLILGNELLDALPFHLVRWSSHAGWLELCVSHDEHQHLTWQTQKIPAALQAQLNSIDTAQFPNGYQTEIRDESKLREFFQILTHPFHGHTAMWWIDYGFAAPELYHPYRNTGTLRTFSHHQAGENPLETPGKIDITAHVDFTTVTRAAAALNFAPTYFHNQGSWLTPLAAPRLINGSLTNQIPAFQTLTHPSQLGGKFHILKLERPAAACPTAMRRLTLS